MSTDPSPAPGKVLRALDREEEMLVVLACTLAGRQAVDLLALTDPERAAPLESAAGGFLALERAARLAAFTRLFAPSPSGPTVRELARRAEAEPPWFAALVCRAVPPEVRERLLASPSLRDAWHLSVAPQPALLEHARRFAARALVG